MVIDPLGLDSVLVAGLRKVALFQSINALVHAEKHVFKKVDDGFLAVCGISAHSGVHLQDHRHNGRHGTPGGILTGADQPPTPVYGVSITPHVALVDQTVHHGGGGGRGQVQSPGQFARGHGRAGLMQSRLRGAGVLRCEIIRAGLLIIENSC